MPASSTKAPQTLIQTDNGTSTFWMIAFAFAVGVAAGFGSIIFRDMIGLVHNLSFDGRLSLAFNVNQHDTRSVWGIGIIFVPVIGAVIVTWLTQKFASEARGHGVPEVMHAIYYGKGKIRPAVAVVKSIASSISIGTGGSVGREGPIIQIGAAFASMLGQMFKTNTRQRVVLIAAGAAAGIAATFNTPIAGLAFAIELMLVTISAVNVALVAIATVTATMVSNLLLGVDPTFYVPHLTSPVMHALNPLLLFSLIPFAVIAGLVSALFIHSIYWFEDHSAALFKNPYYRHMTGMFFLGIILYLMMRYTGAYYVAGVGYSTILDVLNHVITNPFFLLSLCALKMLATGLTLGSGASGGVFSPSLFIGATLGAAYGGLFNTLLPGVHIPVAVFAISGMAALVGGSTGAVLTAIIMTFEQTHDYGVILPIMLAVAISYAVRVKLTNQSIYTLKLYRRGIFLPQGLQAAVSATKRAFDFMEKHFSIIDITKIDDWTQQQSGESTPQCAIITENNQVVGVVSRELNYLISDLDASSLIDKSFVFLSEHTTWPSIMREMQQNNAKVILVTRSKKQTAPKDITGIITRHEIYKSSQKLAAILQ
jgi:chloride channel protein, CIC family